ncbi:unnamed protein product [Owenia fusiformis]|uniref:G-protein coupled receptors family 1 profile domain-containing protein n=1 Tax=Owenia fusiformis TaxID=6347 RepID=A0A8S4NS66_OWEFU|nr:unnamed protein product [Owenia fusiformis]
MFRNKSHFDQGYFFVDPMSDELNMNMSQNMSSDEIDPWQINIYNEYPVMTKLVRNMHTYFLPFLITIGLTGNTLSALVFTKTYLKTISSSVYLTALAVSNNGYLISVLTLWMDTELKWPLYHQKDWCPTMVFLNHLCDFLSAWFVVSFMVERYIAIFYPLKRPEMCTSFRAKIICAVITFIGLSLYVCTTWTNDVLHTPYGSVCLPINPKYENIHFAINYIDFVLILIMPVLTIIIMNIKIAHKISYFYGRQNIEEFRKRHVGKITAKTTNLGSRAQIKVTKVLLILSTVVLLINLPIRAMKLRSTILSIQDQDWRESTLEYLWQTFFNILYYSSFSINFIIYSICSKNFRRALVRYAWQRKYRTMSFFRRRRTFLFRRTPRSVPTEQRNMLDTPSPNPS